MKRWHLTTIRDRFLYAFERSRDDEDALGEWASANAATLILALEQTTDALAFWVDRCDRIESRLPDGLPTTVQIRGIGSISYALGRDLVPESQAERG